MNKIYPQQLADVKSYTVLDEMVLYAPNQEMTFSLNHSAKAIWELCNGKHTIADICEELSKIYGSSSLEILPDVEAAIQQFYKMGILE
jgi:hypothetical protein